MFSLSVSLAYMWDLNFLSSVIAQPVDSLLPAAPAQVQHQFFASQYLPPVSEDDAKL
jgi:hypothetical protein